MGRTFLSNLRVQSNDFRFCVELPIKMQMALMKYKYDLRKKNSWKKVNVFKDGF